MKKYNDIEDLYRDMFSDYNPEPPDKVWENIQAATRSGKKSSLWKKITFPVVGIVVVSAIVYLLVVNLQPNESVATVVNDKQQQGQTKTDADQPKTENESDLLVATNPSATQQTRPTENPLETETKTIEQGQPIYHPENSNLQETQSTVVSKPFVHENKKDTALAVATPPVKHVSEQHPVKITPNRNHSGKVIRISKDTNVCENTSVQLYAYNVDNVRWSTGETQHLITVNPSYDEQYSVTFTTDNKKDSTVYIHVRVAECPDIYIPNAFTPNGDGLNDLFMVKTKMELPFFEMTIYASNGKQLLFSSKNMHQGWDGTYRGQLQPHGLYFYTIRYTDQFGRNIEKRGELLLILQ